MVSNFLFDAYVVTVFDDEGVLLLACINIVGALLYLVVAIGDSVEAAEVEDAGVECAEGVALDSVKSKKAIHIISSITVIVGEKSFPHLATAEGIRYRRVRNALPFDLKAAHSIGE